MCEYNVEVTTDSGFNSHYKLHFTNLPDAIRRVSLLEYGTRHITISNDEDELLAERINDKEWKIVDKRH